MRIQLIIPFNGVLKVGYGWNGRGVILDLRFAPFEVLESIAALEDYPLISDDEHSQLEYDGIAKLWGAWIHSELKAIGIIEQYRARRQYRPDSANS